MANIKLVTTNDDDPLPPEPTGDERLDIVVQGLFDSFKTLIEARHKRWLVHHHPITLESADSIDALRGAVLELEKVCIALSERLKMAEFTADRALSLIGAPRQ